MAQSEADRFRSRAAECRRSAEDAMSELDKEGWLRLAAEWDKLAEIAMRRRGIFDRHG